jgi:hypothetical protein
MFMDDRSGDIVDMADYRCGYARLANDILLPDMYNAFIWTDLQPEWYLVLQGDWNPPPSHAFEVYYFYG